MKRLVLLPILGLLLQIGCSNSEQKEVVKDLGNLEKPQIRESNVSPNLETNAGYLPDEHAASEIAIKAWIPKFGKKQIEDEKPYQASLKNGIWTVTGSLPKGWNVGGVAIAELS